MLTAWASTVATLHMQLLQPTHSTHHPPNTLLARCPLHAFVVGVVITQMQALHRHKQGMSTVAVARQVYRDQGLPGFFKGLMPSMVMVVNPTIQYIIYESLVARALDMRWVCLCCYHRGLP